MKKKTKANARSKNLPVSKEAAKAVKGGNLSPQQAAALASRRPSKNPGGTSGTGGGFIPGLNPVVTS